MEGPPELEQSWRFLEHILLGSRHPGDPEGTLHLACCQWELLGGPDHSMLSLSAPLVPDTCLDYRTFMLTSLLPLPAPSCHHCTLQVTLQPEACILTSACC